MGSLSGTNLLSQQGWVLLAAAELAALHCLVSTCIVTPVVAAVSRLGHTMATTGKASSDAEYEFAGATGSSADLLDDDFDWADDELPPANTAATPVASTQQALAAAVKPREGPIPFKTPSSGAPTTSTPPAAAASATSIVSKQGGPSPAAAAAAAAQPAGAGQPGPKPPLVPPPGPAPGAPVATPAAAAAVPGAATAAATHAAAGKPRPAQAAPGAAATTGAAAAAARAPPAAPAGTARAAPAAAGQRPPASAGSPAAAPAAAAGPRAVPQPGGAMAAATTGTAQGATPAAAATPPAAPKAAAGTTVAIPSAEIAPAPSQEQPTPAAGAEASSSSGLGGSGGGAGPGSASSSSGGSAKGWGGWLAPTGLGGLSSKLQQVALGAAKDLQELTASVQQVRPGRMDDWVDSSQGLWLCAGLRVCSSHFGRIPAALCMCTPLADRSGGCRNRS